MARHHLRGWSVAALTLGLLAACGGGGGGGEETSDTGGGGGGGGGTGTSGFTISGAIEVVDSSAVDSDLNDPNQDNYKLNHNPADPLFPDAGSAQTITTPVLLTGTVNQPSSGPAGNNFAAGDTDDYFKLELSAGQIVEVEFAADTTNNDIDLYVFDAAGNDAGMSTGSDTHFECVSITRSGTYYVNVFAFSGASIYNLHIGAPGTGGSCGNATASFGTAALLAKPHEPGTRQALTTARASAHRAQIARADITVETPQGLGPQLLRLPQTELARRAGLDVLRSSRSAAQAATSATSGPTAARASVATPSAGAKAKMVAMASTLRYTKALRATGAYAYVEPDWLVQSTATIGAFPPNDRLYYKQRWHYEQIQLPAAINRLNALARQPAVRPVVAVIDSGVVLDHPDLAPQLLGSGRSFVGGASTASGDSQETSFDANFHGTHVAGTIAASTFDGSGVAGVAPMAQLLPVNVFGVGSGAFMSDIVNGILYAASLQNSSGFLPARRADVINMSLGSAGSCNPAFQDAITRARNAGVIVVAAAGNEASPVAQPANCAGVIAVSATQADKAIAPYSNTGGAIKVAAPGGNTSLTTTGSGEPDGIYSTIAGITNFGARVASHGNLQGTSMASPHVAGVMALMRYANPALTPAQIDAVLASITDDLGAPGFDSRYGFGLINADKAVAVAIASTGAAPPTPAGKVIAEPASMDFGSVRTAATISLLYSGSSTEKLARITSSNAAVSVLAQTVDANGMGTYSVSVDRASSALTGSTNFVTLTVTLTSARSFTVPLVVTKSTTTGRSGGFGPVYVLLTDAATGTVLQQVRATQTATGYTWTASGVAAGTLAIVAGTDQDNDDLICQRGEACGGYPVLDAALAGQGLVVGANRSDLSFQIAPISGISAQSIGANSSSGFRRPGAAKKNGTSSMR